MDKIKEHPQNSERIPDLTGQFTYRGRDKVHTVDFEWRDISSKEYLPDLPWRQVYIIGSLDNKIPLVQYRNDPDNLPGGKTEPGETVEETAMREAEEELNCRVISWEPLGYQTCYKDGKFDGHELRIYAELEKIGEFESDPGGPVIGYRLIDIENLSNELHWPKTAERLQELSRKYFN